MSQYTVRRIGKDQLTVARFSEHKQPEVVYLITQKRFKKLHSDSPGFARAQQNERSVQIARKFLEEGEPLGVFYHVEDDTIVTTKFM